MTFNELVEQVMTLTARPDLLLETELAVRASTLKAHQSEFYPADLVEESIKFAAPDYIYTLQHKQLFPDWRKLRYIRKCPDGVATEFLQIISAEDSIDAYGLDQDNVAYLAGTVYKIRVNDQTQTFLVGYYKRPNITVTGFDSWVADQFPFAIIYDAAATVSLTVGQLDKANAYSSLAGAELRTLKINAVSELGE